MMRVVGSAVSSGAHHLSVAPPRSDQLVAACGGTIVSMSAPRELGLPRSTIAHRCRVGGPWQALLPGVILLHNGPATRADRRRAAVLYCDESAAASASRAPSLLTGLDALELHGLRRIPSPFGPVHVLVHADVRRVGGGRLLVERTRRMPAPAGGRWPLAPVVRAALDFARRSRDRGVVRSALAEVVQRRMGTVGQLGTELAAGPTRGSALPRQVLAEVSDGVRSAAEAQARTLARRSGLPAPLWNPRLYDGAGRFVAVPDAWFDDVAMAWEIDSNEWHLSPEDYAATVARRGTLMAAGRRTAQVCDGLLVPSTSRPPHISRPTDRAEPGPVHVRVRAHVPGQPLRTPVAGPSPVGDVGEAVVDAEPAPGGERLLEAVTDHVDQGLADALVDRLELGAHGRCLPDPRRRRAVRSPAARGMR
jgi:hypothetical protein